MKARSILRSIVGRLCQIASLPLVLVIWCIGWFAYYEGSKATRRATVLYELEDLELEE